MKELYTKKIKCAMCDANYEVKQVFSRRVKVLKRDDDFCPYYEGENPLFYSLQICPHCGYVSYVANKKEISIKEREDFKTINTNKWQLVELNGYKTLEDAIRLYKIHLALLISLKAQDSRIAKTCLRLAWLYRYKGNTKLEIKYLNYMLNHNTLAFERENLGINPKSEIETMFLLGETHRKFKNYREAQDWFIKVSKHKNINEYRILKLKNKEQWQKASEGRQQNS